MDDIAKLSMIITKYVLDNRYQASGFKIVPLNGTFFLLYNICVE